MNCMIIIILIRSLWREDIPAKVLKADGGEGDILLHVRGLTAEEQEIILDGCLMNYYAKRTN